jgi:hypothetical protein
MAKGGLIWDGAALQKQIDALTIDTIDKLALEVILESDAPVDTGFLDASAYVNSSTGLNTFGETWANGRFISRHSKQLQLRQAVESPQPPPDKGATVGWAAQYAAHVEGRTHFIYNALLRVRANNT